MIGGGAAVERFPVQFSPGVCESGKVANPFKRSPAFLGAVEGEKQGHLIPGETRHIAIGEGERLKGPPDFPFGKGEAHSERREFPMEVESPSRVWPDKSGLAGLFPVVVCVAVEVLCFVAVGRENAPNLGHIDWPNDQIEVQKLSEADIPVNGLG